MSGIGIALLVEVLGGLTAGILLEVVSLRRLGSHVPASATQVPAQRSSTTINVSPHLEQGPGSTVTIFAAERIVVSNNDSSSRSLSTGAAREKTSSGEENDLWVYLVLGGMLLIATVAFFVSNQQAIQHLLMQLAAVLGSFLVGSLLTCRARGVLFDTGAKIYSLAAGVFVGTLVVSARFLTDPPWYDGDYSLLVSRVERVGLLSAGTKYGMGGAVLLLQQLVGLLVCLAVAASIAWFSLGLLARTNAVAVRSGSKSSRMWGWLGARLPAEAPWLVGTIVLAALSIALTGGLAASSTDTSAADDRVSVAGALDDERLCVHVERDGQAAVDQRAQLQRWGAGSKAWRDVGRPVVLDADGDGCSDRTVAAGDKFRWCVEISSQRTVCTREVDT